MEKNRKAGELLMPAGGLKQYIAAVENGADAVYIGGKVFSARAGAENFSDEEAEKAMDYGHLRGVKTYVTMNTLMEEKDLYPALRQAEKYRIMGADALIIQDLGLGRLIRNELPDMPIHLSTQAGACDPEGVAAAVRLGYERVVLARELTFEEIKATVATGVEIEVFVHGALCLCYSGQCQLSRYIGGRSGNKGTCAQPCRLPYAGRPGEKYPLSPKDMCLIEEIGALCEAKVASFKVEGRMKSPEYVAVVTSIYRKYIDLWLRDGSYEVSPEDMGALRQIFNRGGFTKGYFYGDPEKDLMTADFSKNAGIYAGKVAASGRGPLVEIEPPANMPEKACGGGLDGQAGPVPAALPGQPALLEKGDYIEIRGDKLTGGLVTYAETKQIGATLHRGTKNNRGTKNIRQIIGDIKGGAQAGAPVYRLVSGRQMEAARRTFEHVSIDGTGSRCKTPIEMTVTIETGGELSLEVKPAGYVREQGDAAGTDSAQADTAGSRAYSSTDSLSVKVFSDMIPEKTANGHSCAQTAEKQLKKTGNTPFEVTVLEIIEPEPAFVPIAAFNALRRKALEKLEELMIQSYKRKPRPVEEPGRTDDKDGGGENEQTLELWFYNLDEMKEKIVSRAGMVPADGNTAALVPLQDYEEARNFAQDYGLRLIPYLSPVIKGPARRWLDDNIERLTAQLKADGCGIYVGNIGQIDMFASRGVRVYADSGINMTNSQTAAACRSLGACGSAPSLEHASAEDGAFPLMMTEHRFDDSVIVDRKGQAYRLDFDEFTHKTMVRAVRKNEVRLDKAMRKRRVYL